MLESIKSVRSTNPDLFDLLAVTNFTFSTSLIALTIELSEGLILPV